jgi:hypothetical protein
MKIIKTIIKNDDDVTEIYELPDGLIEAIIGVCNAQVDILKMQKELATGIMAETTGQPQYAPASGNRTNSQVPPQRNLQVVPPKGKPTRTDVSANRVVPTQVVPPQINNIEDFQAFYSHVLEEESEDGYQYKSEDFNA